MFFRLQNLEINQHLVYWSLVASGLSVRKKCGFTKPENEEIDSPVIGDQFCNIGQIQSYLGQIQSNLGQIQSYLGQIQS